ncbi:MAG: hypothetical protein RL000_755 [Bacteroidota bacterium]|jgi:hypothetical protein
MGASHIVRILFIILIINTSQIANSQIWLTGKVYDSTRMVTIPAVKVMTKKGEITFTDSIGRYGINVGKDDSVSFTYRGKSTNYFPVKQINYPAGFDVSLQIVVQDRYQTLREVVVVGRSYRQDSLENRERYRKIFEFESSGLQLTSSGNLDPNSLIGAFKFRKNKVMRSFQSRLILEEQEKFVDSRFTKALVRQITGFNDRDLERFMKLWRPPYELVAFSEEYQFYQYILDASRYFKSGILPKARIEERSF